MQIGRLYRKNVDWHAMKNAFRGATDEPLFDSAAREHAHHDHVRLATINELVDYLVRRSGLDPRSRGLQTRFS